MTKHQLPDPIRLLIEQCQHLNFGHITFQIRSGEPDFSKTYSTTQTIKLTGGENGPRREANLRDFELCAEQVALFTTLGAIDDGACVTLEVKHGLPVAMQLTKTVD